LNTSAPAQGHANCSSSTSDGLKSVEQWLAHPTPVKFGSYPARLGQRIDP